MKDHLYHIHRRKIAKGKKYEPYPSRKKHIKLIDKLIYVVVVGGPLLTLPQAFKIWINKDATSIFLFSWCSLLLVSLFWMWYGIAHKERPIILSQILWIIVHLSIIIGTIIYG